MSDAVAVAAEAAESTFQAAPVADVAAGQSAPQTGGKKSKSAKNRGKAPAPQDRRPPIRLDAGVQRAPRQEPNKQGRKDGPKSGREIARDNMINFLPIASHPAEPCQIELKTEYTQRLFQDHFGRAQISLYNLMCYLPIRLRQSRIGNDNGEDFLDALEVVIDGRIQDLTGRLKADLARARKVASDNSVNPTETYSKVPQTVSLPLLTPQIADLLVLLPLFDQYIAYMDALWVARYVQRRARETHINAYRNDIVTLIRHLMHLYHESKRLVDKGDSKEFSKLLLAPVDENALPVALDEHEEQAARAITGVEAGNDVAAIAA